jgi:hypothetical protein
MHAVAKALAISAAVAWAFLGVAAILVLGTIGQPFQEPSFILAGIICLSGLALALCSLWLFGRGSGAVASALSFIATAGAAIMLIGLIIMMSGNPGA